MIAEGPIPRVRVTHPRTDAARRAPHRPASREIGEQTELGEVFMASLIRSQRRLAFGVCAAVAVLLGGIALLGAWSPRFAGFRILAVPLPWVILGVVVYPVLIGLAAYTVGQAERNERLFTAMVRRR
ncbi:MAG: hypothetical protein M3O28_13635 [Actinomycetota bacterium]|nr:hypothetical protein [Actinomycetota bacterium]